VIYSRELLLHIIQIIINTHLLCVLLYIVLWNLVAQSYEVNSRGLEIFSKSWLPETIPPKAMVYFCHGYGDTCTFFVEGLWLANTYLSLRLVFLGRLFLKLVFLLRHCKKTSIFRLWSICHGLSWIWSFRRSSWLYTKFWQVSWWCHWALLEGERYNLPQWTYLSSFSSHGFFW